MEKEIDKRIEQVVERVKKGTSKNATMNYPTQNTVLVSDEDNKGVVKIADEVVAMIAALAATEVEGVSDMSGNLTNELKNKVGMKNLSRGVKIEIKDGNVTVDLSVTMDYGYNIPATCQQVQTKVKSAIENMTGLTCNDVNIRIAGVSMKKEK